MEPDPGERGTRESCTIGTIKPTSLVSTYSNLKSLFEDTQARQGGKPLRGSQ